MKKILVLSLCFLAAPLLLAQPNPNGDGTHFVVPNPSDQATVGWIQPIGPPLWDNGLPDGVNGYSNATDGVLGAGIRRTLLADFVVPGGQTWDVTDITWRHVWGTPPGAPIGTDLELRILADLAGSPDTTTVIATASVGTYTEMPTGAVFFSRNEMESFAGFTAINLAPGSYWLDATIVGPENNFWLTSPQVNGTNCWVDYSDLGGLQDCATQFGVDGDINFTLGGMSMIPVELTGFEVD